MSCIHQTVGCKVFIQKKIQWTNRGIIKINPNFPPSLLSKNLVKGSIWITGLFFIKNHTSYINFDIICFSLLWKWANLLKIDIMPQLTTRKRTKLTSATMFSN